MLYILVNNFCVLTFKTLVEVNQFIVIIMLSVAEAYSELGQTCKVERFVKTVNDLVFNLFYMLHLECLTGLTLLSFI